MAVIEAAAPEKPEKEPIDDEMRRKKIGAGSWMKVVIRPGGGDLTPSDGDQVTYHCSIITLEGVFVQSSRSEHGGNGIPIRSVLGKSKLIVGLLEGMQKGEIAMLRMKPQVHYGEEGCPLSAPSGFPKEDELHFEIEVMDFFKAKVISDDLGVVKKVITEGQGWESPREPYKVKVRISAKTADGKVLIPLTREEPFFFNFGKSEIPKGLEMGISTMTREEKAIIYVRSQYLTSSAFLPVSEGVEEVHFDVELVDFIQVKDILGDGRLIKRRIRDGEVHRQRLYMYNGPKAFRPALYLSISSDGNYMIDDVASHPVDADELLFAGYSKNLACFHNKDKGFFIFWNVEDEVEVRWVVYNVHDPLSKDSVCCFSTGEGGALKIVVFSVYEKSLYYRVFSSDPGVGMISGGFYDAERVCKEDNTWGVWRIFQGYGEFEIDIKQLPMVAHHCKCYVHGTLRNRSTILEYDFITDEIRGLTSPVAGTVSLGYGYNGCLAVTCCNWFRLGEHEIDTWGLQSDQGHGLGQDMGQWKRIAKLTLNMCSAPSALSYSSLGCILNTVGDAQSYIFFLCDKNHVLRVTLAGDDGKMRSGEGVYLQSSVQQFVSLEPAEEDEELSGSS